MPELNVNGTTLYYEDSGPPPEPPGETIVFAHGLLMNCSMFAPQVAVLRTKYRCIAYDHRGQGRSADSHSRCIDIETVAADAVALIGALGLAPVHFCGLSMGGFVGLRLGIRHPDLLRSLLLLDTSADPEPQENRFKYRLMNTIARWFGLGVVSDRVVPLMFGHSFLADETKTEERAAAIALCMGNRRSIWRAVNGVIERRGVAGDIGAIRTPTLVIVGEEDVSTVPAKAEAITAGIPGARLARIPRAGHSSTLENPEAVTAAISEFLAGVR